MILIHRSCLIVLMYPFKVNLADKIISFGIYVRALESPFTCFVDEIFHHKC